MGSLGVSLPFPSPCLLSLLTPQKKISITDLTMSKPPGGKFRYAQSPNALPFAQASYTLRVYDSRGPDATAEAGLFNGANSILTFAMYSPAAYTPLASGWTCVGCSAAVRALGGVQSGVWVAVPVTVALVLIGGAGVLGR